ncbi:amidohydrolase family protein [Paenibacillus xylaniclasticus]|uniref:amidohydrolase family protein n=1 Tax=Paenibacillus xylaniclasticus TaxID=588083 RepID=UPI000FD8B7E7|nr:MULTISPECIES: amidohydrolase [Paenibacillus]GFN31417.1 5-methylthioadenosine/S-adenosylhomocysteine deaminase [Paenibacillus curdlanolyticus]
MQKLFTADYVYLAGDFCKDGALLVENGMIQDTGTRADLEARYPGAELVAWEGQAIVPGTVNAHNHSFQSLLRGIAIDKPFLEWRDQALYKYTPLLKEEDIYTGALLAFGEMLRYGVTTVCDFFYIHHDGTAYDEAVIRAANDLGIRFVMARTMYDWDGAPIAYRESIADAVSRTRSLAVKYQGNPMVAIHPAPHSPHAASPEMIQAGHRLAQELDTPYHIHVAEEMFEVEEILRDYGKRPIHYLDSLGVLDERMIAIHLVWLDDSEIALAGSRSASLAYCPSSNMFLADGITRIPDLVKAGVTVSLGTDGACSNNRNSVYEEMRMVSLLQKVARLDGTCMTAQQAYQMGTDNGGKVLRLPVGKLEAGYYADFNALDIHDLSLAPRNELFANMVYAMQPSAVKRVVVGGRVVYDNNDIVTIPERSISTRVDALFDRLLESNNS